MSTTSPRRPYSPSDNDHLIFKWVKLDGESQSWVADQFGISQSTVSRIIQRYERWLAHADEREGGHLDHSERVRYQRWLTMERNDQIIASCLRIAQKLEGFIDSSRSTTLHAQRHPSDETKVRTEHFTIDRTASVCRFLRLAYRIGMDQFKLSQLAPPPPPNPLSESELAQEDHDIAAIQDDFAEAKRRAAERQAQEEAQRAQQQAEMQRLQELELAERRQLAEQLASTEPSANPSPTSNVELETSNADLHNLQNVCTPQIAATTDQSCTCAPLPTPKKISKPSRITPAADPPAAEDSDAGAPAAEQSDWPGNGKSKRPRRRLVTKPR